MSMADQEYDIYCSSRIDTDHFNPIAARAAELRTSGIPVRALNDSNPTHHGLAPQILLQSYDADPKGSLQSRRELAAMLSRQQSRTVHPEQLYVLDSTSQGYSWIITALCDTGDAVLAPAPGYPLIESICNLQGVQCIDYQLQYDGSWYIDIAQLQSLCEANPRIRALIVVNPNNPTGSYIHDTDRASLIALCRTYHLALIADEVFFDFSLEPLAKPHRFAGEEQVVTFALDGLSKRLAAPHAKVGWIEVSGPQQLCSRVMRTLDSIADAYLPYSVLTQEALPQLLAAIDEHHHTIVTRIRTNLTTLQHLLAEHPSGVVSLLRAEAGWNVLLRFPSSIDENELGIAMLNRYHMIIQPGYLFDMTSNGYVAVSLLPEADEFAYGVRSLLQTVDDLLGNV